MSDARNIELAREIVAALEDGATVGAIYPLGRELTEGVTMRLDAGEMVIETQHPTLDERYLARVPDCDWRRFAQGEIDELRDVIMVTLRAWLRKWEAERENETEQTRRGRLPKAESAAKQTQLLALLVQHPTLVDDPAAAAAMAGISESTARRMIDKWRHQNRQRKDDRD